MTTTSPFVGVCDSAMSDLEIAVAFCHVMLFSDTPEDALRLYAAPALTVHSPRGPVLTRADAIRALREDLVDTYESMGEPVTQYYRARAGLVVGRVSRPVRVIGTGELRDLHRTEWITVGQRSVQRVELQYFTESPPPVRETGSDVETLPSPACEDRW
jgi:hypothetical protein